MLRAALLTLALAPAAAGQAPRFQFKAGDALTYSVEQTTTVTETTAADTVTSTVKLALTRRWDVTGVDAAGVATLDLTVTALKQDITRAGKPGTPPDVVSVDSATPEGKQALAAVLGKPVLTVKIDPAGTLVGVESRTESPTGRVAVELPFRVAFPAGPVAVNTPWPRACVLTLDPPHGAGEKVDLVQTFTLRGESQGYWVVGLETAAKAEAKEPADRVPVVPVLWAGDLFFDPVKGRYAGAKLTVKREVAGAAGPGSKFAYESTYTEALAK